MMPLRKLVPDYHRAIIIAGSLAIVVIMLVVSASIIGSYALTVSYVHRVNAIAVAQYDACKSGNESRKSQIVLWNHVLDVSANDKQNQNPQQRKVRREFRVFIAKTFAPHRCTLRD